MFHPLPTEEPHAEAQAAADPVDEHTEPDAGQAHVELQDENIAQNHAEQPHTDDADRHRVLGIAARAQGVGQGKARRPEEHAEQIEPVDHMGTHRRSLGREAEPGHDLGHQDEQRQVGQRQAGYGNAHQGHGVALGLLFLARAQTLADDGNRR